MDTLQQFAGRPSIVERTIPREDGTVVKERAYISVHDAEHIRHRSAWKKQLAWAHSDHNGSDAQFRIVKAQQEHWLATERTWYAQYDLEPPLFGSSRPTGTPWVAVGPPPAQVLSVKNFRAHSMHVPARLWRLLADGAVHAAADLLHLDDGGVPITSRQRSRGIELLRSRGARIDAVRSGRDMSSYQLLSPPTTYRHAHQASITNRLADILADGQIHQRADLCRVLQANPNALGVSLTRLVYRGAAIQRVILRGVHTYQLLPSSSAA